MRQVSFDDGDYSPRRQWQYPREYIDKLREMADTPGIIGQYVDIKQSGSGRWMGICPFHNDTNPSLSVSLHGYRCFGCDAKGDVINFLMSHQGMTFVEAIRYLQQSTGLTPPDKKEALGGAWNLTPPDEEHRKIQEGDTVEKMMWDIASKCQGPLRDWGDNPIVYERIMTIFRIADDALEAGDSDLLSDIIHRITNGLLTWKRISNEQGRENKGSGGSAGIDNRMPPLSTEG